MHPTYPRTEREALADLGAFASRRDAEAAAEFAAWTEHNQPTWAQEQGRTFTADDRRKAAKEGAALPDGSFPIYNQGDLDNAARLSGKGDASEDRVIAHIRKRAKQLGLKVPDSLDTD